MCHNNSAFLIQVSIETMQNATWQNTCESHCAHICPCTQTHISFKIKCIACLRAAHPPRWVLGRRDVCISVLEIMRNMPSVPRAVSRDPSHQPLFWMQNLLQHLTILTIQFQDQKYQAYHICVWGLRLQVFRKPTIEYESATPIPIVIWPQTRWYQLPMHDGSVWDVPAILD